MAVGNNDNTTTYYSVRKGKLCKSVPAGTKGAVQKLDKDNNPTDKWEMQYDWVQGILLDVVYKEKEHEGTLYKSLLIHLLNEGHYLDIIEMNYTSAYASRFFNALANIHLNDPIKILLWMFADKENPAKIMQGCTLLQDNVKVPPLFTKEAPGVLPPMEKVMRDGKEVWDSSAQMAWYLAWFLQDVKPWIVDPRKSAENRSLQVDKKAEDGVPAGIAGETDDLPF
jgi:hypothetical protein